MAHPVRAEQAALPLHVVDAQAGAFAVRDFGHLGVGLGTLESAFDDDAGHGSLLL